MAPWKVPSFVLKFEITYSKGEIELIVKEKDDGSINN